MVRVVDRGCLLGLFSARVAAPGLRLFFLRVLRLLKAEVDEVFEARRVLAEGILEGAEVGTVVLLRLQNRGEEEVVGGSLAFIHNNYRSQKMIYLQY